MHRPTWTRFLAVGVTALVGLYGCSDDTITDATCGAGTELQGDVCVPVGDSTTCGEGTMLVDGVCVPTGGGGGNTCGMGTMEVNGECVATGGGGDITCGDGTELNEAGDTCLPIDGPGDLTCGEGTMAVDGACVPSAPAITCGEGTMEMDGTCVSDAVTVTCGDGTQLNDDGTACELESPILTCGEGTHEEEGSCVLDVPAPCETGATVCDDTPDSTDVLWCDETRSWINVACNIACTDFALGADCGAIMETEPNDDLAGAQDLGALADGILPVEGAATLEDSDWYAITLDTAGLLFAWAEPSLVTEGDLDVIITLTDSDGQIIDVIEAVDSESFLEWGLPAGDYFIIVDAGTAAAPYRLVTEFEGFEITDLGELAVDSSTTVESEGEDDDGELYSFSLTDTYAVSIWTDIHSTLEGAPDTAITLLDWDLNPIDSDDDGGEELFSAIDATLPAGNYYVLVEFLDGAEPYSLTVDVTDGGAIDLGTLTDGETVEEMGDSLRDMDWFEFNLDSAKTFRAWIVGEDADDTFATLWDADGEPLAGVFGGEMIELWLDAGDYVITVDFFDGPVAYDLIFDIATPECEPDTGACTDDQLIVCNSLGEREESITCAGGCADGDCIDTDEVEPNDTVENAQDFGALVEGTAGTISAELTDPTTGAGDVDWFTFTLTEDSVVFAGVDTENGDPDTEIWINDDLGELVASNDDGEDSLDPEVEVFLSAGTYSIKVESSTSLDAPAFGAYRVWVLSFAIDCFPGDTMCGDDEILWACTDDGSLEIAEECAVGCEEDDFSPATCVWIGEEESNDAPELASPIGELPMEMRGILDEDGGGEFVAIEIPVDGTLHLSTWAFYDDGSEIDLTLTLWDSEGNVVEDVDDVEGSLLPSMSVELLPGEYVAEIGLLDEEARGWWWSLVADFEPAPPANEPDDDATMATAIDVPGGPWMADITDGDHDWYTFTLAEEDIPVTFTFESTGVEGRRTFDSKMFLCDDTDAANCTYDDTDSHLARNDDAIGLYSAITHTFDTAGTYYVVMQGFSSSSDGFYWLNVWPEGEPNNTPDQAIEADVLGTWVNDLNSADDVDFYEIEVEAAGTLIMETFPVEDGVDTDTRIWLCAADTDVCTYSEGYIVRNHDRDFFGGDLYSTIEHDFPGPGTWYIGVDSEGDDGGDYELRIHPPGEPNDDGENAVELDLGGSSGTISTGSDRDFFTIDVEEDEMLTFITTPVEGGAFVDTVIYICDAASVDPCTAQEGHVAMDDDSAGGGYSQLTWVFATAGTYYIVVESYGGDTGDYDLVVLPAGEPNDSALDATPIDLPGSWEAAYDVRNDEDWYVFEITEADTTINISTFEVDGSTDTRIFLCDDSDPKACTYDQGENLARDDDGGDGLFSGLSYTFAEAGTYYLVVGGWFSPGPYGLDIQVEGFEVEPNDDADSAQIVSTFDEIQGHISVGDQDWYIVLVDAGETLTITTSDAGTGDTVDTRLFLCDDSDLSNCAYGDGNLAANDDIGGGNLYSSIEHTFATGGLFWIVVEGFNTSSGDYLLTVESDLIPVEPNDSPAEATELTVPGGADGEITANDHDWFTFTLAADANLRFETSAQPGEANMDTRIFLCDDTDPDNCDYFGGNLAANDDVGGGNFFSAVEANLTAGTYYIVVRGFSGTSTGLYHLEVTDLSVP